MIKIPRNLRAYQAARLRDILVYVQERVPHYGNQFRIAGLCPRKFSKITDLGRFPFTTKGDLQAGYPLGFLAIPYNQIARLHSSSGSRGRPTLVAYSRNDLRTWTQIMRESLELSGVRSSDVVHIGYGYGMFTGGSGVHAGAEALGCTVIPAATARSSLQVELLRSLKPTVLLSTPSFAVHFHEVLQTHGVERETIPFRLGVHGAEPWSESLRSFLAHNVVTEARDMYGLAEVIGPGVAAERYETPGQMIIREDHFYPEIVDPDTGEVLPDGEPGELVLTTLSKEAMPLIRYRTGDLTRFVGVDPCGLRCIERIETRADDVFFVKGVNVYPSAIEDVILNHGSFSPHFQIVRKPDRDTILHVEPSEHVPKECWDQETADLVHRLKETLGVRLKVTPVAPGCVERSQGKAQRFVEGS